MLSLADLAKVIEEEWADGSCTCEPDIKTEPGSFRLPFGSLKDYENENRRDPGRVLYRRRSILRGALCVQSQRHAGLGLHFIAVLVFLGGARHTFLRFVRFQRNATRCNGLKFERRGRGKGKASVKGGRRQSHRGIFLSPVASISRPPTIPHRFCLLATPRPTSRHRNWSTEKLENDSMSLILETCERKQSVSSNRKLNLLYSLQIRWRISIMCQFRMLRKVITGAIKTFFYWKETRNRRNKLYSNTQDADNRIGKKLVDICL